MGSLEGEKLQVNNQFKTSHIFILCGIKYQIESGELTQFLTQFTLKV